MTTWVIGGGGLFGSALVRHSAQQFVGDPIPWSNFDQAIATLKANLEVFSRQAGDSWSIAWAAGRATTSSSPDEIERELQLFQAFINHLAAHIPPGRGSFLLTSSAGGIYAGSANPPFSSSSTAQPISGYGRLKLRQEQIASDRLGSDLPVVIARLSNLYGPGQDLDKLQGLVSRLALAAITKEALGVFVPLDTLRDYIYTDDAAVRALVWLNDSQLTQVKGTRIVVIASGQAATVGQLITDMTDVARVRIPIAYGLHASSAGQAHDLRLIPDSSEKIASLPLTPLVVGMKQVYRDLLQRHSLAQLAN